MQSNSENASVTNTLTYLGLKKKNLFLFNLNLAPLVNVMRLLFIDTDAATYARPIFTSKARTYQKGEINR